MRHTLDAMHVERNVCNNLLLHLLGDKDTVKVRRDMEVARSHDYLHLRQRADSSTFFKPHAPYVLLPNEKATFLNTVSSLRTPTGYSSAFTKHVGDQKLSGLKSHDYHVLMQQIVPACTRAILHPQVREVICRLSTTFQRICAKTITESEIKDMKIYAAVTLCLMEIWFPPGFFDIMTHLIIHLVEELEWCGPVHARWMYGIERYMYVLKGFVRNRARPEAAIAERYMSHETLRFVSEYVPHMQPPFKRMWSLEEDLKNNSEVVMGHGRVRLVEEPELLKLHDFVITNSKATERVYRSLTNPCPSRRNLHGKGNSGEK